MYQTFYIDVDEEIASVIDRLRKSAFEENFFVIPKRALILQSIVNLKLIKREAEKNGKQAVIVTQDEMGIAMAQKADLQVRTSTEGLDMQRDSLVYSSEQQNQINIETTNNQQINVKNMSPAGSVDKQKRLAQVGSNDFYGGFGVGREEIRTETLRQMPTQAMPTKAVSSAAQVFSDGVIRKNPLSQNLPPQKTLPQQKIPNDIQKMPEAESGLRGIQAQLREKSDVSLGRSNQINTQKAQRIEKIFQTPQRVSEQPKPKKEAEVVVGKKTKKVFFWFLLLCVIALGGAFAYIYVPSADITVSLEKKNNKFDVAISGKAEEGNSFDKAETIPIKVIEKDESVTMEYESTGSSSVNGQKARGKVVISNLYSSEPQQLIATTRLKSESGKIFRITKNVVVPGVSGTGEQQKAGTVEVEVVADQAGAEYNIDASTFTIPGFEGGPKYEKFSAKSSEKISGGASDGSSAKAVASEDITSAKKKSEETAKGKIREKLSAELANGEVLLDEAMEISIVQSAASSKTGETRDTFEYVVKAHVKAVIFSKSDVERMVVEKYKSQFQGQTEQGRIEGVNLDYAAVTPEYTEKELSMKVHAEVLTESGFNSDSFKKDVLGKNEAQIKEILSKYPEISNLDIEFQPQLISRIPQFEQRVTVRIAE